MLRLFLFSITVIAACLPDIYINALSRCITQEIAEIVVSKINFRLSSLFKINYCRITVKKFYETILENQAMLRQPFEKHCDKNSECLRLSDFLVEALELKFRETQLPPLSFLEPPNIAFGVLHHFQILRTISYSYLMSPDYKQIINIQRMFQANLLYLKLRNEIECSGNVKMLKLLEQRQAEYLSLLVQNLASYFLNWLTRESGHILPPILKQELFKCPNVSHWYEKLTGIKYSQAVEMKNFDSLLLQHVSIPLEKYEMNPRAFEADVQFSLVMHLLYLHQQSFNFSIFTNPETRKLVLDIEFNIILQYKKLENIFKLILEIVRKSTSLMHVLEPERAQILRFSKGEFEVHRTEVYYVDFARPRNITSCMTKNGTLKLYFSNSDPKLITDNGIREIIEDIISSGKTFSIDLLIQHFLCED